MMFTTRKILLLVVSLSAVVLADANAKTSSLPDALSTTTLENGATLGSLSQPQRGTAIVALRFEGGSFQDSIPGLAHLAEHLFLRSPLTIDGQAQTLRDFLSLNGGRQEAQTGYDNTRFYFEVNAESLDTFLRQLSAMIAAPGFSRDALHSELAAIDDEFTFVQTRLSWRLHDALKAATPETHPFRHFKVGNRESFSQYEPEQLFSLARDFIHDHYRANNLSALVVAPRSTAEIESVVASTLGRLPSREHQRAAVAPLLDRAKLPAELRIKEAVSHPQLNLMFPLSDIPEHRANAAIDRLQVLARASGEASWREQLIATGLVRAASLGRGLSVGGESTLRVTLSLTPENLSQRPALISLVTRSLRALAEQAADLDTLVEQGDVPTIVDQATALRWLARIAEQSAPAPKAADATAVDPKTSDPTFITRLNRDNVLAILVDSNVTGKSRSPVFDVAYTLAPLRYPGGDDSTATFSTFAVKPQKQRAAIAVTAAQPRLLLQSPMLTAWHSSNTAPDDEVLIKLSLTLPTTNDSLPNRVLWSVWYRDLQRFTQNDADSRWYRHTDGARIEMRGSVAQLDQKLASLSAWLNRPLTDREFHSLKQNVIADWQTPPSYRFAFEALVDQLKEMVLLNEDDEAIKLSALQPLQHERLLALREHSLQAMRATLYVYGASEQQAQQLTQTFRERAPLVAMLPEQTDLVARIGPRDLSQQEMRVALPGKESALLHYQALPKSLPADDAKYHLLLPLIRRQYFSAIREEQKLAYGVTVVPVSLDDQRGIAFIAQSAHSSPEQLRAATRAFLSEFPAWLDSLPADTFEQFKHSVRKSLQSEPKQGKQLADHYWSQITEGRIDTDWKLSVRNALDTIDQETLARYYQSAFAADNAVVLEGWQQG